MKLERVEVFMQAVEKVCIFARLVLVWLLVTPFSSGQHPKLLDQTLFCHIYLHLRLLRLKYQAARYITRPLQK